MNIQNRVDTVATRIVARRGTLHNTLHDATLDPVDRYRAARRLMAEIDDDRSALAMLEAGQ